VATKVGGIPEIVEEGYNGNLVPVKSPEEIAEKLILMNNRPERRKEMGENARKTILEKYSVERVLGMYERVYSSLVAKQ